MINDTVDRSKTVHIVSWPGLTKWDHTGEWGQSIYYRKINNLRLNNSLIT
jgi:hypothetical protein